MPRVSGFTVKATVELFVPTEGKSLDAMTKAHTAATADANALVEWATDLGHKVTVTDPVMVTRNIDAPTAEPEPGAVLAGALAELAPTTNADAPKGKAGKAVPHADAA